MIFLILFLLPSTTPTTPPNSAHLSSPTNPPLPLTFENFYDLHQFKNYTKLCTKGVWLTYESEDFIVNSKSEVGLVSGDLCVGDEGIRSVQPVEGGLMMFGGKFFGGLGVGFGGKGGWESPKTSVPPSSSIITRGHNEWTLSPADAPPICISPTAKSLSNPICFVPKLVDGVKIKSNFFLSVKRGCDQNVKKMNLYFCVEYGRGWSRLENLVHKLSPRQSPPPPPPSPTPKPGPAKLEPSCTPTTFEDKIDKDGLYLLETRLSMNLQSDMNFLWPKNLENAWKLEALELAYSVTMKSCNVERNMLQMGREIFVFLWEKSMGSSGAGNATKNANAKTKNGTNDARADMEWELLLQELRICNQLVEFDESTDFLAPDPMYLPRDPFDPIIELTYIVTNHALSTCHVLLNSKTDFWPRYINIFLEKYFKVVEGQWVEPGKLKNVYRYLFGGWIMREFMDDMVMCATRSLSRVRNLDPFARWIEAKGRV